MKHIILAAGQGTRLRPYTNELPKCMVEFEGVTLLDRQIQVINCIGDQEIIIVGGYRSEMLPAHYRAYINDDYENTNMLWSLFKAEDEMVDEVIISYGDIVYSPDILKKLVNSREDISVVIDKDWRAYWNSRSSNPLGDAESLKLTYDGYISEIGFTPLSLDGIEGQYIGLMKFSSNGINALKHFFHSAIKEGLIFSNRDVKRMYMTDVLQCLIDGKNKVKAVPIYGDWVEVDTVSDLHLDVTATRLRHIKELCNEL